jgi:hypothetical protein
MTRGDIWSWDGKGAGANSRTALEYSPGSFLNARLSTTAHAPADDYQAKQDLKLRPMNCPPIRGRA